MNQWIDPIRIEVPLDVMFPSVNCYLVPGKQLSLVDCGSYSKENWRLLQAKVHEQGFKVSDIEQVIITHEHRDHIGLLPEIMAATDAIVRVPEAIANWLLHPDKIQKKQKQFTKSIFQRLGFPEQVLEQSIHFLDQNRRSRKIEHPERIEFYQEGAILELANTQWEVLNTPGHCPTQHVFIQQEERRIFGSDMLLPIAPMPIIVEDPIKPGQPVRALPDLLRSYKRLLDLNLAQVYPGHGPVFTDANAVINKQLARIQQRKSECLEAIRSGIKTPYQINRKMYPYQSMPPNFSGMYMVLGYLDLLLEEGSIQQLPDELSYSAVDLPQ